MNISLLRSMLLDNVIPMPSNTEFVNRVRDLTPESSIEDVDAIINSSQDKIISFRAANVRMVDVEATPDEIAEVFIKYNKYRDQIFPPSNIFIYVKLETGGFAGYDSRLGKAGEKVYPVLRLTLSCGKHIFDEFINPRGAEQYIHDSTKTYLERNKTLTNALNSDLGIAEVNKKLEEFFKEINLPAHQPSINRQVTLVSANSKFNEAFIYNHLPALKKVTGQIGIDINLIVRTLETSGITTVPLNIYGDDPIRYIAEMRKYHKLLRQGLSHV